MNLQILHSRWLLQNIKQKGNSVDKQFLRPCCTISVALNSLYFYYLLRYSNNFFTPNSKGFLFSLCCTARPKYQCLPELPALSWHPPCCSHRASPAPQRVSQPCAAARANGSACEAPCWPPASAAWHSSRPSLHPSGSAANTCRAQQGPWDNNDTQTRAASPPVGGDAFGLPSSVAEVQLGQ